MAETTGLLNRRTGHSVPRVRISSSPPNSLILKQLENLAPKIAPFFGAFFFIIARDCL